MCLDSILTLKLRNNNEDLLSFYNMLDSSKYLVSGLSEDKKEIEVVLKSDEDLTELSTFIFINFTYNFCDKIVSNYFIDKNYTVKIEDTLMIDNLQEIREYLLSESVKKAREDDKFKSEVTSDILEKLKLHIKEYNILELKGFQTFKLKEYRKYFLNLISHTYDKMMRKHLAMLLENITNTQLEMEGTINEDD